MTGSPFETSVLWQLGPIPITRPVLTASVLVLALGLGARAVTRRLSLDQPSRAQQLLEMLVGTLRAEIRATLEQPPEPFLPLLGALFVFVLSANLCGLIPGIEPPTATLETDLALALLVFAATLWHGVRAQGLRGYLRSYLHPTPLMLPLNLIEAVTRVVSMTVRLFGNIMSGVFVGGIVLSLAGLLLPIPFMALDVLTGVVQAYIFTVLAMVFIGAATGHE